MNAAHNYYNNWSHYFLLEISQLKE